MLLILDRAVLTTFAQRPPLIIQSMLCPARRDWFGGDCAIFERVENAAQRENGVGLTSEKIIEQVPEKVKSQSHLQYPVPNTPLPPTVVY